ncbi:hypothetical protein CB1_000589012 [Camelus ferus]|nr:hypothetical protein CB1_000589012 [Camelus ferus]
MEDTWQGPPQKPQGPPARPAHQQRAHALHFWRALASEKFGGTVTLEQPSVEILEAGLLLPLPPAPTQPKGAKGKVQVAACSQLSRGPTAPERQQWDLLMGSQVRIPSKAPKAPERLDQWSRNPEFTAGSVEVLTQLRVELRGTSPSSSSALTADVACDGKGSLWCREAWV